MSERTSGPDTSDLVKLIAVGETSAFDQILQRYNQELVLKARPYIRRLRMYEPLYEGQEAVDDAVVEMCERARRGELTSIQDSVAFWRQFLVELRRAVRRTRNQFKAQKRGARLGECKPPRRRELNEEALAPAKGRLPERLDLDRLFSKAPPPEDLAHVNLEIEAFLISLEDPALQQVLKMRIDEFTIQDIAEKLDVSSRTVSRNLLFIRSRFEARYQQ
jgi:DNA-directed RNA polymerase specialized sigma24 family protein